MISTYLDELKYIRNVSPKTLDLYHWAFKAFEGALESRASVIARVADMRKAGKKPVTVNTYLRCVNAYFKWLHNEHGQPLIVLPKLKEEQHIITTLTGEQMNKILQWRPATPHDVSVYTLVCLILDTGLRLEEALCLPKEDIDMDNMILKVLGKGSKYRLVPFSPECRKIVYRHLRTQVSKLVFTTRNNTKLTQRNLLRDFKRLGKLIGRPDLHAHMLRHTFAVSYLRNGGNIEYLRRLLGHSDLKTTQKYLRGLGIDDLAAVHSNLSPLSRR